MSRGEAHRVPSVSIEKFWTQLVAAIEAAELGRDPRLAERQGHIENYEALSAELNAIFVRRDLAEWRERARGARGAVDRRPRW
jgi:crotonobetainyl-CoA:carnitine CoA-transferase CaiB-like acyl-CoA transferase